MMRGRELKALKLPQLVEARMREGDDVPPVSSPNSMAHSQQCSHSSSVTASDVPSPTFSIRGHSRFGSSTSSVASSPPMRESIDGFGSGLRPLTEVNEELQERDEEDFEMIDTAENGELFAGQNSPQYSKLNWTLENPEALHWLSYDLTDDALDNEFPPNPVVKRQRANTSPSPFNGLTSRMTTSISRKWRSRKASPIIPGQDSREPSLSRANSTRAPSFASANYEANLSHGYALPPTPTRSTHDEGLEDINGASVDSQTILVEHQDEAEDQAKPTTPLLPPIMTHIPDHIKDIPYQSPLQSPSVAEPEAPSLGVSPLQTPRSVGLPSPPLSTQPSTASFQRQRGALVVPSSEIPPMLISEVGDHWADALGHANFTIYPEPYEPIRPDVEACRQLRANWDAARYSYAKHLARTGDNYGTTSKVYRLTEEKWMEVDGTWKRNTDASFAYVTASSPASAMSLSQGEVATEPPPLVKMPSLNGPKSEGKFPKVGDEGIVGPMEVVVSPLLLQQQQKQSLQQPARKKRKLGFFRWVQGVWPAGVGVFGRGSSSSP